MCVITTHLKVKWLLLLWSQHWKWNACYCYGRNIENEIIIVMTTTLKVKWLSLWWPQPWKNWYSVFNSRLPCVRLLCWYLVTLYTFKPLYVVTYLEASPHHSVLASASILQGDICIVKVQVNFPSFICLPI